MTQPPSFLTERQSDFRNSLLLLLDEVLARLDSARGVVRGLDGEPRLLPNSAALLSQYRQDVVRLFGEARPADGEDAATPSDAVSATGSVSKKSMTRESALDQLAEIAAFFSKTEPQSIVGPALKELVRRGRMNVYALLREMIPDDRDRVAALQRLGLREPEEHEPSS